MHKDPVVHKDPAVVGGHRDPARRPDPVRRSIETLHEIELRRRWIHDHPGTSEHEYAKWKAEAEKTASPTHENEYVRWAEEAGRETAQAERQADQDQHIAAAIRDAERAARVPEALFAGGMWVEDPGGGEHFVWESLRIWNALNEVADFARESQGAAINAVPDGLPAVEAEARRSARDLREFFIVTSEAAFSALKDTAAKSMTLEPGVDAERSYLNRLANLSRAIDAWHAAVSREARPADSVLAPLAGAGEKALTEVRDIHRALVSAIKARGDALPDVLAAGIPLRLSALSAELGRQFASRSADPQISFMYARVGEDPRSTTNMMDWPEPLLIAARSNPEALAGDIERLLLGATRDEQLDKSQKQALVEALRAHGGTLPAATARWRQAFDPARRDLAAMQSSVNDIMFTLSAYRDVIARLDLVTEHVLLQPIEALRFSLQQTLQRFQPGPGAARV